MKKSIFLNIFLIFLKKENQKEKDIQSISKKKKIDIFNKKLE